MSLKTITVLACAMMAISAMNLSTDFEDGPSPSKEQPKPRPAPAFPFLNLPLPKIERADSQSERKVDFPPFPFLNLPAPNSRGETKSEPEKKPVHFPPFPFPVFPTPKHSHDHEKKEVKITLPNVSVEKRKKTTEIVSEG